MPHLFIILSLQGTDSFSLFKFDLLTSLLACNLENVWVVLSMKDTGCQIITLYYRLRCQQPVRKLHLTCHYFCWPFACEEHWATQPQPNCTFGHARTIHCGVCEASACSDGALCTNSLAGMQVSIVCLNLARQLGLSASCRRPHLKTAGIPELLEIF